MIIFLVIVGALLEPLIVTGLNDETCEISPTNLGHISVYDAPPGDEEKIIELTTTAIKKFGTENVVAVKNFVMQNYKKQVKTCSF